MFFFPETYQALIEDKDKFRAEPTRYFVPGLFWTVLIINTLASFGVGWLIVRGAQFAKFPHGVFLSVLLFISYLQMLCLILIFVVLFYYSKNSLAFNFANYLKIRYICPQKNLTPS